MGSRPLIVVALVWLAAVVTWIRFFDREISFVWMAPSPPKQTALIVAIYFATFAYVVFLVGWLFPLGLGIYRLVQHH